MISVLRRIIIENNFKWSGLEIDHYENITITKTVLYNSTITNILYRYVYTVLLHHVFLRNLYYSGTKLQCEIKLHFKKS